VGKATNLRQRVRSYFGSDDRRKIGPMLRETQRVGHIVTHDVISAEVLEMRYLHSMLPRYNRVGTTWRRYCYVRLNTAESWPRLSVVSEPNASGIHVGPLPSKAAASAVIEAIHSVLPLRRCSMRLGRAFVAAAGAPPCAAAQLGVALCPCSGTASSGDYARAVAAAVAAITHSPHIVLAPLWQRIGTLAAERRYEEAALARDRAHAFGSAMRRQRLTDQLRAAGDTALQIGTAVLHLDGGVLTAVRTHGQLPTPLPLAAPRVPALPHPLPREAVDEVLLLSRAIERSATNARVLWCAGEWSWPTVQVPRITRLDAA
jgi:DNA polymerase-3 subunit epsilon